MFAICNLIFLKQAAPYDPPADAFEKGHSSSAVSPTIGQMWSSLVTNPQMTILMVCFVFFTIANQIYAGTLTYFFRVTGHYDSYTFALTARSVCALVASIVAPGIAVKLGKKGTLFISWFIAAGVGLGFKFFCYNNGETNVVLAMVLVCLYQAAQYLYMSYFANYFIDCGEWGYHKTGIDNRTMALTVSSWPTKLGNMFGGSIVALGIAWAGYVPPSGSGADLGSFSSMSRFLDVFGLIPAILSIVAALGIVFFYKLTDKEAAECAKANEEREKELAVAQGNNN